MWKLHCKGACLKKKLPESHPSARHVSYVYPRLQLCDSAHRDCHTHRELCVRPALLLQAPIEGIGPQLWDKFNQLLKINLRRTCCLHQPNVVNPTSSWEKLGWGFTLAVPPLHLRILLSMHHTQGFITYLHSKEAGGHGFHPPIWLPSLFAPMYRERLQLLSSGRQSTLHTLRGRLAMHVSECACSAPLRSNRSQADRPVHCTLTVFPCHVRRHCWKSDPSGALRGCRPPPARALPAVATA